MAEPSRPRVPAAAKRTVTVGVRMTRLERARVLTAARKHDPPTLAAWLRDVISREVDRPRPRPPEK